MVNHHHFYCYLNSLLLSTESTDWFWMLFCSSQYVIHVPGHCIIDYASLKNWIVFKLVWRESWTISTNKEQVGVYWVPCNLTTKHTRRAWRKGSELRKLRIVQNLLLEYLKANINVALDLVSKEEHDSRQCIHVSEPCLVLSLHWYPWVFKLDLVLFQ